MSASVRLGDARTAIRIGESLDATAIPAGLIGRRTQVNLDLARAYALRRQDAAAVNALLAAELLIHAYDVTCGLGLPYEPPEELCRLVIEHCYPGQIISRRPVWPFLVWLSGRRHPAAAGWGQPPPLHERAEIPLEFGCDTATGEWRAIRWAT